MPSSDVIAKHHASLLKLERNALKVLTSQGKDTTQLKRIVSYRVDQLRAFRLINEFEASVLRAV